MKKKYLLIMHDCNGEIRKEDVVAVEFKDKEDYDAAISELITDEVFTCAIPLDWVKKAIKEG